MTKYYNKETIYDNIDAISIFSLASHNVCGCFYFMNYMENIHISPLTSGQQ